MVLWSPRSVISRWVRAEATIADRKKTLMPVTIEACERPTVFELPQTAELSHWKGYTHDSAWLALLAHTRQMVEARAPARPTPAEASLAPSGEPRHSPRQTLDHHPAVRQHERRCRTGVFHR